MPKPNGVTRTIKAAGSLQALANRWKVSRNAIYHFQKQGFFPLDRAKDAAETYGLPIRDLVSPEQREAMDMASNQA